MGQTMKTKQLDACISCGSDDLCEIFGSNVVECQDCEARHYPPGPVSSDWTLNANIAGIKAIQDAQDMVRGCFNE